MAFTTRLVPACTHRSEVPPPLRLPPWMNVTFWCTVSTLVPPIVSGSSATTVYTKSFVASPFTHRPLVSVPTFGAAGSSTRSVHVDVSTWVWLKKRSLTTAVVSVQTPPSLRHLEFRSYRPVATSHFVSTPHGVSVTVSVVVPG